jgi:tripartite ATP-independent transporter DctM subunit
MYICCLVVIGLMTWRSSVTALAFLSLGSKSQSGLPLFPSAAMIPVGSLLLFIIFLRDILSNIRTGLRDHFNWIVWLPMIALPLVLMALATLGMLGVFSGINTYVLGGMSIIVLFGLMFLGMPLALAFILLAVVLTGFSSGIMAGFMLIGKTLYTQTAEYNWSVIPLFTFMSFIFMASEIGSECFVAAYKWIGHYRGGLAIATIMACTAFAAVNGGPLPAIIIMGTLGLPEMRKYAYADTLSSGSILAGSTLGPMIPPSISFIIYGIIARESIGTLFIAGLMPGFLLALSFIVVIMVSCRINPELAPAGPKFGWIERFRTIPMFLPILVLFLCVIGGIYAGVFSAMEGGGIGAFGAFVIALASGRFNWQKFKISLAESAKTNSMLLFVIVAGLIFGNSLGASGLSTKLVELTRAMGVSPIQFIILILIVYLLFGIICDAPIILLLTLPILAPMMKGLGVNMIWFGVITTLIVNLGAITPPFAMGIFMLKNVGPPDLTLSSMYRGIIPYCTATAAVVVTLMVFPKLATWLPALMM